MIATPDGQRIGVVQIAGLVARRIVPFAREGETVGAGERIGMIRFGSRRRCLSARGQRALVAEGQTAIAGETVLADLRPRRGRPDLVRRELEDALRPRAARGAGAAMAASVSALCEISSP